MLAMTMGIPARNDDTISILCPKCNKQIRLCQDVQNGTILICKYCDAQFVLNLTLISSSTSIPQD